MYYGAKKLVILKQKPSESLSYSEFCHLVRTKNDLKRGLPLAILIIIVPFGATLALPIFVHFPQVFTRQFWTEEVLSNILEHRHSNRVKYLDELSRRCIEHYGLQVEHKTHSKFINDWIDQGLTLEKLPKNHLRLLAQVHGIGVPTSLVSLCPKNVIMEKLYSHAQTLYRMDRLLFKADKISDVLPSIDIPNSSGTSSSIASVEEKLFLDERCLRQHPFPDSEEEKKKQPNSLHQSDYSCEQKQLAMPRINVLSSLDCKNSSSGSTSAPSAAFTFSPLVSHWLRFHRQLVLSSSESLRMSSETTDEKKDGDSHHPSKLILSCQLHLPALLHSRRPLPSFIA